MNTTPPVNLVQARFHIRSLPCPQCARQGTLTAHQVVKEGPNTGRLFAKCASCGAFQWLDGKPQSAQPRRAALQADPPTESQSQELGLLEDIATHPEDAGPRLIYADWLEDHGESHRAEFVRLGVHDPHHPRGQELLARHGSLWFGPVEELAERRHLEGGLIESVSLTSSAFVAHARRLILAAPVAEWTVQCSAWSEIRSLSSVPEFARVHRLRLVGCYLGGDGVRIVASCHRAAGLRSLALPHMGLGVPGVQALTISAYLGKLRRLDLSANNLTSSAVAILASASSLASLTHLNLSGNMLDDSAVRALVHSRHLTALTDLNLSGNPDLTSEAADALVQSELLQRCRQLNVSDTGIGSSGVHRLLQATGGGRSLTLIT